MKFKLPINTTAGGAATAVTPYFSGYTYALEVDVDTLAAAGTITLTNELGVTIFAKAIGAADAYWPMRMEVLDAAGAAVTGAVSPVKLVNDRVTATIASGGATKAGTLWLHVADHRRVSR